MNTIKREQIINYLERKTLYYLNRYESTNKEPNYTNLLLFTHFNFYKDLLEIFTSNSPKPNLKRTADDIFRERIESTKEALIRQSSFFTPTNDPMSAYVLGLKNSLNIRFFSMLEKGLQA